MQDLKPINLTEDELLYQQGDAAKDIYFIHSGRIRLVVDLNDFVKDPTL